MYNLGNMNPDTKGGLRRRQFFLTYLTGIVVSTYPFFFLFFRNISKVKFNDILPDLLLCALMGVAVTSISLIIVRHPGKAAYYATFLLLFLINFRRVLELVQRYLSSFYYWHLVIIAVIFFLVLGRLLRYLGDTSDGPNIPVMLYIFGALTLINLLTAVPQFLAQHSQPTSDSVDLPENLSPDQRVEEKPNIYYFIFDEFAGLQNSKRYLGFDNPEFFSGLENRGFSVSYDSYAKTIDSFTEIPNMLQLAEVNSVNMPDNQKRENTRNPRLLVLMKNIGYQSNQMDIPYYNFLDESLADFQFSSEMSPAFGSFSSLLFEHMFFYPFYGQTEYEQAVSFTLNQFDYAANSPKISPAGVITIGYFSFPHPPFIFDQDGGAVPETETNNLRNVNNYYDQYIFASRKILDLVDAIQAQDPAGIIILQSDHGFRYPNLLHDWYGDESFDLAAEAHYQKNTLNAVYTPGNQIAIEGLNNIETLKKVLDIEFGIQLDHEK